MATSSKAEQSHLKRWLFCWGLIVSAALFAGCSSERLPAELFGPVQLSGPTMGTSWHLTYTPSAQLASSSEVQQGIEGILDQVNSSMSTYLKDSEISRFNRAGADEWFPVTSGFMAVLQAALAIGETSGGAYDVTVGPVVNLWGFGPQAPIDSVPDLSALAELLLHIGQDKLQIDEPQLKILKTDQLSLDFSSIAKGYGVDAVADWLVAGGVEDFLVEVGGEIRLGGVNPKGLPWRIAIEQPDSMMGSVATAINVTGQGVATSGDYRNYFEVEGKRYSHTIDPRTGFPISHDLVSVTVIHASAMVADGWATAFMVMGAQKAMKVALEQELAVYFIRRIEQNFISSYSPQFVRYLDAAEQGLQGSPETK